MKRILAAALTVFMLSGSIVAQAGDHGRDRHSRHDAGGRHDRHARSHHDHHHSHRVYVREQSWDDRRDYAHAYADGYRHSRYDGGRYYQPAGYRYYAWHHGARLPVAYYAPRYIVRDYADYRLYRPPHGHHWVRVDHDVVLAAVATGVVVAVVNNLFF